jgi:hypothetical protein
VRKLAFLLVIAASSANLCFGWGEEGHRLVVRLAEGLLTPAARAQVAATLAPGDSLEELASWADEVRRTRKETEPWHYIDIPLHSMGLDMKRDCPQNDCIIAKIADFRKQWRDPSASPEARREALLFLVHFVGDLHQPLHCEDNQDKGGNDVAVEFFGSHTNLHSMWDSGLLKRMPGEDHLFTVLRQLADEHSGDWPRGTVEQWATESFHISQQTVYGLLPATANSEPARLGEWYEQMVTPVIEEQLAKAGVRLAAILNGTAQ